MTDDADQEREDLQALLASPGWRRVMQHVRDTWGPEAYARKLEEAAYDTVLRNGGAQVVFATAEAKRAIEIVLVWPLERVAQLSRKDQTEDTYADHRRA